jgi:hypothetical protein
MGQDKFIVWDTIGMAEDLGRSVNSKWTMQRWRAEHDFLVKEINARRYSSDQIVKDHAVCLAGKVAVRLVSAREIADEGSRMRHCVASYIPHVRRGEYLVYSIRDSIDGPSLATLGLRAQCYPLILGEPAPAARWHLDQMYGPCNSEVDFPFDVQKLVSLLEPPTPVYKYVEAAGDFDLPL